jgi:c-di-GMP-binding flagellar brake protein YcgR
MLYEGVKVTVDIRIVDGEGKRRVLSLPSVVEEICPDGFFLIQTPMYQGTYYPIPRDKMFFIYFSLGLGKDGMPDMYVIPARFIEIVERKKLVLSKLEPLGSIERSQRRDCYRLPISMSVSLKRTADEDDLSVSAKMINFSDGGMLIATDAEFEKNESVVLDFSIGDNETVEGVVLRTEKMENGRHSFRVAIEFSNADRAQRERFYRFITEQQSEKMKRQKASTRL